MALGQKKTKCPLFNYSQEPNRQVQVQCMNFVSCVLLIHHAITCALFANNKIKIITVRRLQCFQKLLNSILYICECQSSDGRNHKFQFLSQSQLKLCSDNLPATYTPVKYPFLLFLHLPQNILSIKCIHITPQINETQTIYRIFLQIMCRFAVSKVSFRIEWEN